MCREEIEHNAKNQVNIQRLQLDYFIASMMFNNILFPNFLNQAILFPLSLFMIKAHNRIQILLIINKETLEHY